MSVRYHINPETMRPNICRAKTPESCPYYDKETQTPDPHFDSKPEAREYVETVLKKKHGETATLKKVDSASTDPEGEYEKRVAEQRQKAREYEISLAEKKIRSIRQNIKDLQTPSDNSEHAEKLRRARVRRNNISLSQEKQKIAELQSEIREQRMKELEEEVESHREALKNLEDLSQSQGITEGEEALMEIVIPNTEEEMKKSLMELQELRKEEAEVFKTPERREIEGYMGSKGWVGSKYDPDLSLTEVAKSVRADLKKATDAGYLPEGVKYRVTSKDGALNMKVLDLPADEEVYKYDVWEATYGSYEYDYSKELRPQYRELRDRLQAIHDSYNYDRSNIMVDYFNVGHYGTVEMEDERERSYREFQTAVNRQRRVVNKLRRDGLSDDQIRSDQSYMNATTLRQEEKRRHKRELKILNRVVEQIRWTGIIDRSKVEREVQRR